LKLKLTNETHTHIDFKMLTFVRLNSQLTSEITYLFAYYLLVCQYAIGCIRLHYVKWKLCKCLYTTQS